MGRTSPLIPEKAKSQRTLVLVISISPSAHVWNYEKQPVERRSLREPGNEDYHSAAPPLAAGVLRQSPHFSSSRYSLPYCQFPGLSSLEKKSRKYRHFDDVQRTSPLGFRIAGTPCFDDISLVPTRVFHLRIVTHGSSPR
jgi:hypothetical protein